MGREKAESSKRKEGNSSLNRNVNSSLNRGGKTAKRSSPSSCDRSVAQPILLQGKNKFTDYNSCRRDAWQAFRKKKKITNSTQRRGIWGQEEQEEGRETVFE